MYTLVLTVHSWLRWLAIVAGVAATMAAMSAAELPPKSRAERWGLVLMIALDTQMLLGLLLYLGLSPITAQALQNFGGAMGDSELRFWAVEHAAAMLAAVGLAHAARVLARTAKTPASKRTRLLVCYGLATLAMLFATPWPGMANSRPLFRF